MKISCGKLNLIDFDLRIRSLENAEFDEYPVWPSMLVVFIVINVNGSIFESTIHLPLILLSTLQYRYFIKTTSSSALFLKAVPCQWKATKPFRVPGL